MKFDYQLPPMVVGLIICCFIFPVLPGYHFPLMEGLTVTAAESIQALLLFGFAIFSFLYIRPYNLSHGQSKFWLWSVAWWIMLFGRSISWGRDYFPDVPKVYFRGISILMIAPVVFMLGSKALRHEISYKFRHSALSFWALLLVLISLVISDGIEHGRPMVSLVLSDPAYKDLLEELYEFPLIIGLFLIAWPLMQQDCAQENRLCMLDQQEKTTDSEQDISLHKMR